MKKIFTVVLLAFSLGANAFFNNNDMPWNNGFNNNSYGYQQDNGIFSYNPYDYWDPRWYMEEMSNMVDEFDNNNNNRYAYNPYNNNSYNNNPWNGAVPAAPATKAVVK